jgi:hypothetical protein
MMKLPASLVSTDDEKLVEQQVFDGQAAPKELRRLFKNRL